MDTASKHTGGKLRVGGGVTPSYTTLATDDGVIVVNQFPDPEFDGVNCPDMDTARANAHRLALAWNCHDELLETLSRLVMASQIIERAEESDIDQWDDLKDATANAQRVLNEIAAITKATGEAR